MLQCRLRAQGLLTAPHPPETTHPSARLAESSEYATKTHKQETASPCPYLWAGDLAFGRQDELLSFTRWLSKGEKKVEQMKQ